MNFFKSLFRTAALRLSIMKNLFNFLKENKMLWLVPMIVLLLVFFVVLIFAQSSPLGPFIYTLF